MDIGSLRQEYLRAGLNRADLDQDPFKQFEHWFHQACEVKVPEPNAMSLATATAEGAPSIRTVLLKYFDREGLVFFTNFESRKSREIEQNPHVALLFFWADLERQIKIVGRAEKISTAETLKYFATRPRGSQLGAWCSQQSAVIGSRQLLEMKLDELKRKFRNHEVPLPSFWGGYRVAPHGFEFWQGRPNRLHDRFQYSRQGDGTWLIERLAP
jgi:pyridoxamine 5'-phosphate oxidase